MAHVFRGPRVFGALAHIFRGPKVLDPSSWFQRPRILGLWLMFSKDQRFWIQAHVFKDLGFLDLGSCFQRSKGFLRFGSCFQWTKGSRSWLMFSKA